MTRPSSNQSAGFLRRQRQYWNFVEDASHMREQRLFGDDRFHFRDQGLCLKNCSPIAADKNKWNVKATSRGCGHTDFTHLFAVPLKAREQHMSLGCGGR